MNYRILRAPAAEFIGTALFVLVGAGLIAGLVLSLLAGRGIGSLLVGVSPSDPVTLISVALLLAAVGLVASYIPARRAMNIEPLKALKYE